jgi:hypothetical protein
MSKHRLAFAALALAALAWVRPAAAKDFPEPVLAVDPLAAASRTGIPAGMGSSFEYGYFAFSHDEVDSSYFRLSASPVILRAGDSFALGAAYETELLIGPVSAGQTAANIASFWMNAVQFEYGLYASLALRGRGSARILAEYSRTSQHPLHSGNSYTYSEVTADILMLGLSFSRLEAGPLALQAYLRAGYYDLFDFWGSSLPDPRISWIVKPAVEAQADLGHGLFALARAYPQIFIDKYTRELDANIFAEAGIAAEKGPDSTEILLTVYGSRDSDMLKATPHPTFEAGLLLRFADNRAWHGDP